MKSRHSAQRTAKPHGDSTPCATRSIGPVATYGLYGHSVLLAIAAGLASEAALAACPAAAGARLQANAGSTCAAAGSYTGTGVTGGRGALTSLTGGVINATAAVTMPLSLTGVAGAYASDAGSQINLQGDATITRTGTSTGNRGLHALNGGAITVDGQLSIDLPNGSGNHGVLTEGTGTLVTLNGPVDITMRSGTAFAPGIRALTGSAVIANGAVTIHTAGDNRSDAVAAADSATVTLNGALDLTTSGVQASALKVTTAGRITYNGQATFNISSINGSGIRAVTGGVATANASSNTTINVTGVNGQGISSRDPGSQVSLAGTMLINVGGATQANFPSGNLESYAAGLLADLGGAITSTGPLRINATHATGYGALLAGSNSTIAATGGGTVTSAGVAIGFLAGADQKANFDGFAIRNTSGDLVQVNAATGSSSLALTNSTASAVSGSKLLNVSNGSTFALTANRSTLSGDIVTDAGSAVSMSLLNSSSLTGAIDPVTLAIDGTSRWTMTGDSVLSGLTLAGRIDFQAPGTAFVPKTLTVNGNWVGQGGTVRLNTSLGDSGSQTDRIVINGGTVSGSTNLQINNAGGLGALTTGNGIEVISALNGATTTAQTTRNAFALTGGHIDAGAYEYRLYAADASGAGENWYLRSTTTVTAPTGTGGSTGSTGTSAVQVPAYRAEVPLLSALPSQLRQMNLIMIGNLHQRIGDDDIRVDGAASAGSDRRAWARMLSTDIDIRQGGAVSPSSKGHLTGFQAGTDLLAMPNWRAGIYVGQLDGDASVRGFASGIQNLAVGRNDLRSQYVGVYGTYTSDSGFYADAVVQSGRHRYTVEPLVSPGVGGKGNSLLGSIEVGQAFALGGSGWSVEPQLQLIHQHMDLNNSAIAGAIAQPQADSGWIARAGVRVKGQIDTGIGTLQPYGRFNVYRTSSGADIARFVNGATTTDISAPTGGTSTELAGGFTLALGQTTSLYGEVGKLWASGGDAKVKSSINGSLGIRVKW
ncbi:outer membrane autotransporter barrel domain-containing protein [Variovorax sp. YR266]|uniref:autotransporter family protein n=1 Tax=Variovorax sp. YR266 TaxID=1884386 RepID=UPI00089C8C16|nr:autotransporter outer membrane beta-barrel domain-containing protein [Variovorax sp. YR266]SDZ70771.1 outer membrane autotransporter barrel domain-containing protein [Variovorax sp. YR266]